ncbi:MAG: DUF401 family protein [Pyrobaculum sp.]
MFSQYIKESGLGELLASNLGGAAVTATFLVSFLIGLATGMEFIFAALAFPPLSPLLHSRLLAVAFIGGFLGVMLSPAHSCLVLTVDYYKADTSRVHALLVRATILSVVAIIPLCLLLS